MMENNKKLDVAREHLMEATKIISELIEGQINPEAKLEDWMKDRIELWCRIFNKGGIVTQNRLHEIWKGMGKDTRGLGGFFTGKNSSLQYTHDEKVVLTLNAKNSIEAWTGKSVEEYSKKYKGD